jgi:DNA-binding beta-propeller fold protein YncE
MGKRLGVGDYQYEAVENWAGITIPGVASDVATDSKRRVYVATRTNQSFDNKTGAILVFDEHGKFLSAFGGDKLATPHHITVGPDDEIFHTDAADHTVRKYSTDGELLQVIGTPGQPGLPDAPFNQPTCAVRSAKSGDIFVSDGYRQSRIHRFTGEGELILSWGKGDLNLYDEEVYHSQATPGTGPGEFHCPHGLCIDDEDRVYVQDRSNRRIQVFDNEGNYLSEWEITSPNQSVIDEKGIIHTASGTEITVSTLDGKNLGAWGEKGDEAWQFTGGAHGLWIDNAGSVYVGQVGAENGLNKYARI